MHMSWIFADLIGVQLRTQKTLVILNECEESPDFQKILDLCQKYNIYVNFLTSY